MPKREHPHVKGTLEFRGKTYPGVDVRYNGNSTFMMSAGSDKRPLKIDLNKHIKGHKIDGQTTLNPANNLSDPSMMREALAYEVFRRAGVPAPRTAFVRVSLTVAGKYDRKYLGLYTIDEQVDERFLRDHFGTDEGLLLKPGISRGLPDLGDEWEAYERQYEPKTKVKPAAARRVIEFVKLANAKGEDGDKRFRNRIGSYLDVDEFLNFLAVNAALANLDSFLAMGQNYYLYLNPKTDRIV